MQALFSVLLCYQSNLFWCELPHFSAVYYTFIKSEFMYSSWLSALLFSRLLRTFLLPLHAVSDSQRTRLVLLHAAAGCLLCGVLLTPLLHQRAPQHSCKTDFGREGDILGEVVCTLKPCLRRNSPTKNRKIFPLCPQSMSAFTQTTGSAVVCMLGQQSAVKVCNDKPSELPKLFTSCCCEVLCSHKLKKFSHRCSDLR